VKPGIVLESKLKLTRTVDCMVAPDEASAVAVFSKAHGGWSAIFDY